MQPDSAHSAETTRQRSASARPAGSPLVAVCASRINGHVSASVNTISRKCELQQQYFPDHDQPAHNPMTGVNNAYIPDRVLGHAVAEWSVQTAVGFLEHFREQLSVTPRSGLLWPTKAMLMTR
jgi:hypothetical protein